MKTGILEPLDFSLRALQRLAGIGQVESYQGGPLADFLKDKEVLFVRLNHLIDRNFLGMAPDLKVVVSPTTGHTHVDLDELKRHGIAWLSLKGERAFLSSIRATPEHAVGLILALLRNYKGAFLSPSNPYWDRDRYRGTEVNGKTIGILGMGRVGKAVAGILLAMAARIVYFDPDPDVETPAEAERLFSPQAVAAASDILLLTASYERGMEPIAERRVLEEMRKGYFINVARGELVDEAALLDLLTRDWFAGVALDVLDSELSPASQLGKFLDLAATKNLIVTPHIGGATFDSMRRTEEFMVDKLTDFLASGQIATTRQEGESD